MSAHPSTTSERLDDAESVRRASERVERLLSELRASSAPSSWARIEELVASVTTLHGRGLARVLDAFAAAGAVDDRVRDALCDDPLIASLLLLHGLHPEPIEGRIGRAVERVRRAIGEGAGVIELASLDEARSLTLRLTGSWKACPAPRPAVLAALRRAIEEAAPEVAHVEIEGAPELAGGKSELVQIDLSRSREARS